ncbi:MAG: HAD family phosphatase, partial [Rubrobacter sp.]|nr:HAD family phosphatase [Rubrobacter sp.]MBA3426334.1 HAD family phosphatase [Rubrobacter sp.]
MLKALMFDLDGTLAETDSLHLPTWVDVLAPHGIEVDEEFYRERISG